MSTQQELDIKMHQGYMKGIYTLYDCLGHFMYQDKPLPEWLVQAIEQGFNDRIAGKCDLDRVFGLTPKGDKQADKFARRLQYSPQVYWSVKSLNEDHGYAIDMELFNKIAEDMAPIFQKEWPDKKPPKGRTLKEWYLSELKMRAPEEAAKRDKSRSKTV